MRVNLTFILLAIFVFSCKSDKEAKGGGTEHLRNYKLAMVQMKVVGGEQEENLQTAGERIAEAAAKGARIAVLPEALDFGWCHSSAKEGAGLIPGGRSFEVLSRAARENNIFVCAGIHELVREDLYNAAVIIDNKGKLLLKHRKLNELDFAHQLYSLGNVLNVVDTQLGTLGLLICADATAADFALAKSLGLMGADIIFSPSAWAVPPEHNNLTDPYGGTWISAYKPICNIFNIYYIGVSNVGTLDDGAWTGWNCIGSSIAMDAAGEKVVHAPYGVDADTILYLDVKLKNRPARGTGWYERFRSAQN